MTTSDQSLAAIAEAEKIGVYLSDTMFGGTSMDRLADPSLNPALYARICELSHRLRTSPDVEYVDHAPSGAKPFDRDDPAMAAVPMLHYAGDRNPLTVHVLRDLDEVKRFGWLWRRAPRGICDIGEAVDCRGASMCGSYMTITRPPMTLAFEVCGPCEFHLRDTALTGEIVGEIGAQLDFDAAAEAARARWAAAR